MFSSKRKLDDLYFGGITTKKRSKTDEQDSERDNTHEDDKKNHKMDNCNMNGKTLMRRDNHIYFHCEVSKKTIYELVELIREAEEKCYLNAFKFNIPTIPIYLHINSFGGSIFAAFNAIDVITSCRVPVYTIIEGATASAGTLISIVGEKRYIRPTSYMLIHQLSSTCWGKMSEIEDEYKNLTELMDRITTLYKNHSKIPKKELTDLLKHDLWLNADKCLKYRLVDEIWDK